MFVLTTRLWLAITSLLLFSPAGWAQQTSAADFYAAYTHALAKYRPALLLSHPTPEQARLIAELPQVERDLEATVRRLVGPVSAPKGFTGNGKWNGNFAPVAFEKGASGILFSQSDPIWDHPYVLVSTVDLLRQWPSLPPEARADPELLFRESLQGSTEIMFKGVWSVTAGLLPIKPSPGIDVAIAAANSTGNGFLGARPPNEISVYARKGDRIYIASVPPATAFPSTVSCDVDLRAAQEITDPVLLRPLAKQCWENGAKDDPATAAATRQAQAFSDDLAEH